MENIRDKYDYVGWVPCVSGHLLFEYSNCGLSQNESEIYSEINHVEYDTATQESCRYIIVSSSVNWKDKKTHLDGKYRLILLTSMSIRADQLEGQVFIIPYNNNNCEWENGRIGEDLSEIKRLTLADEDIKTRRGQHRNSFALEGNHELIGTQQAHRHHCRAERRREDDLRP